MAAAEDEDREPPSHRAFLGRLRHLAQLLRAAAPDLMSDPRSYKFARSNWSAARAASVPSWARDILRETARLAEIAVWSCDNVKKSSLFCERIFAHVVLVSFALGPAEMRLIEDTMLYRTGVRKFSSLAISPRYCLRRSIRTGFLMYLFPLAPAESRLRRGDVSTLVGLPVPEVRTVSAGPIPFVRPSDEGVLTLAPPSILRRDARSPAPTILILPKASRTEPKPRPKIPPANVSPVATKRGRESDAGGRGPAKSRSVRSRPAKSRSVRSRPAKSRSVRSRSAKSRSAGSRAAKSRPGANQKNEMVLPGIDHRLLFAPRLALPPMTREVVEQSSAVAARHRIAYQRGNVCVWLRCDDEDSFRIHAVGERLSDDWWRIGTSGPGTTGRRAPFKKEQTFDWWERWTSGNEVINVTVRVENGKKWMGARTVVTDLPCAERTHAESGRTD